MSASAPPPVIDMARVIEYAILDESVRWTGRQLIFVGKQQLGPVPRLAICQNLSGDLKDILVFYCNEQWEVLGCAGADTLEEAKVRAERAYEGITGKWIASNVTEEQAKSWIRDNCPDMSCSFCQREPMDFDNLIESKSGTTRICNYCIDEFHEWIHKPERDGSAT